MIFIPSVFCVGGSEFMSKFDLDHDGEITSFEFVSYFSKMAEYVGYDDALQMLKSLVHDMQDAKPDSG